MNYALLVKKRNRRFRIDSMENLWDDSRNLKHGRNLLRVISNHAMLFVRIRFEVCKVHPPLYVGGSAGF